MKKSTPIFGKIGFLLIFSLTACQPTNSPSNSPANVTTNTDVNKNEHLIGCYTVSRDEPAQIKISKQGDQYVMQMREHNNPNKVWDNPEPLEIIANENPELRKYFDIKVDEQQVIEQSLARADRVFVLAKISDSFANINPQFDSPYLGFIYQGSNSIYQVSCENPTTIDKKEQS